MSWHFWFQTDAGLFARIGIAACVFAILAMSDLLRHGRDVRRGREYAFLICAALAGLIYGAANDLITSSISWEYYYYGKGLFDVLGPKTPPDPTRLHWEAARIGMKAAGSAGLIIGAAFLMANNPRPRRPQLPYRRLAVPLFMTFAICTVCGTAMGVFGFQGGLTWTSHDLQMLVRDDLFHPARFLCVYGVHLGAYIGGAIGVIGGIFWITQERRRAGIAQTTVPPSFAL